MMFEPSTRRCLVCAMLTLGPAKAGSH